MSNTFLHRAMSNEATDFTEALAGTGSTGLPPFAATAIRHLPIAGKGFSRYLIRAIEVTAMQNFGPQFNFFYNAVGITNDPATDSFVSRFGFFGVQGLQIAGSNLWRYYIDGLAIPYHDRDTGGSVNQPTLHVILENTDTVAKAAAGAGLVEANFWLEPQQSY